MKGKPTTLRVQREMRTHKEGNIKGGAAHRGRVAD